MKGKGKIMELTVEKSESVERIGEQLYEMPESIKKSLRVCDWCKCNETLHIYKEEYPREIMGDLSETYSVSCVACGCTGPDERTPEEAIIKWNNKETDEKQNDGN